MSAAVAMLSPPLQLPLSLSRLPPQDPWFRQFLPDLSKLAVAQAREQQGVAEITRILQVGRGLLACCLPVCRELVSGSRR